MGNALSILLISSDVPPFLPCFYLLITHKDSTVLCQTRTIKPPQLTERMDPSFCESGRILYEYDNSA